MPENKEPNADQEQAEEAAPKQARFPIKKYGTYAAIVVVMIAAAYFITLKVVKPMLAGGGAATEETSKDSHASAKKKQSHKRLSDYSSSSEQGTGSVHLIEDIIVNPAGTGGRRFLSTSIGFELSTPEASTLFEERDAVVRDALITILSSQSIPELSDFKQRERLRKLIQLRVQKLLGTEEVAAVYFTEFVLQ